MNTPFPMPDEYLQGFLKAAQSMTQSLVTSPVSPNAIAAPSNGAPLADIQLGYLQQQLQLWGRMLTSGAAAEPGGDVSVIEADRLVETGRRIVVPRQSVQNSAALSPGAHGVGPQDQAALVAGQGRL